MTWLKFVVVKALPPQEGAKEGLIRRPYTWLLVGRSRNDVQVRSQREFETRREAEDDINLFKEAIAAARTDSEAHDSDEFPAWE